MSIRPRRVLLHTAILAAVVFVPVVFDLGTRVSGQVPSASDSPRYAMDVRNKVWMLRADDVWTRAEKWWWAALGIKGAAEYLAFNRYKPKAWATIGRGPRDGFSARPST